MKFLVGYIGGIHVYFSSNLSLYLSSLIAYQFTA